MLTRSGVAKLLRRSVATVQRPEGHELFPKRDARGVHRFDECEAAEVARRLKVGEVESARGEWIRRQHRFGRLRASREIATIPKPQSQGGDEISQLREENARLKVDLVELTTASTELLEELESLGCR